MINIAEQVIPDLSVKSAGSLKVRPGGSNATGLRLGAADNILLSASFTPTATEHIKEIRLLLKKVGTITSGKVISVSIQANNAGDPDGTAIGTSANVETDTIGSDAIWVCFSFTNHVQVVKSTVYHAVLSGDYTVSGANYIAWISATVTSAGNQEIKDASWADVATENFNIESRIWNLPALGIAEPILYNAAEYPGVFDAPGSTITIGETEVQSSQPSVEIRTADIAAPATATVVKARGVSYYVQEVIPDSNGTQRLMLSQDTVT
jgi:hypothetical protein